MFLGTLNYETKPNGNLEAYVPSTPVSLTIGKRYELTGWVRTRIGGTRGERGKRKQARSYGGTHRLL
jgi:hypothetical protein